MLSTRHTLGGHGRCSMHSGLFADSLQKFPPDSSYSGTSAGLWVVLSPFDINVDVYARASGVTNASVSATGYTGEGNGEAPSHWGCYYCIVPNAGSLLWTFCAKGPYTHGHGQISHWEKLGLKDVRISYTNMSSQ